MLHRPPMLETNRRLTTLFSSMADLLAAQSDMLRADVVRAQRLPGETLHAEAPAKDRAGTVDRARGTNPHRIKAYRRAAATIAALSEDIRMVAARGELQQLSGIGRELSAKIEEFLKTGSIRAYEQLTRPLPPDVRRWCNLPGFSEPLVQQLYHRLGIQTVQDLEALVRSHFLRTLPGVTISEEIVLEAIRKEGTAAGEQASTHRAEEA